MKKMNDIVVVGAGIVGLAVAYKLLLQKPNLKILIIEKEKEIARHQTGNNSGVIHTGIYYKPGSLKAKTCVDGVSQLLSFCEKNNISVNPCGKVIVATHESELKGLEELYRRATANGVKGVTLISPEQVQEIEPMVTQSIKGLHSPNTSIIDYIKVSLALKTQIEALGGTVLTDTQCKSIQQTPSSVVIETTNGPFESSYLINCGGVWSDDLARYAALPMKEKMIPFRGEYFCLKEPMAQKIKGLIYPVPNPQFPFLGVHLTRMISGKVEAGPNAVLALAKDGYKKTSISPKHLMSLFLYPGFWKMTGKYWKTGVYEVYRSFYKKEFLKSLQRLVPELEETDLIPGGAGIRAQLVNPDGSLIDDFCIKKTERMLHVLNAPSPAATASLSIADSIVSEYLEL